MDREAADIDQAASGEDTWQTLGEVLQTLASEAGFPRRPETWASAPRNPDRLREPIRGVGEELPIRASDGTGPNWCTGPLLASVPSERGEPLSGALSASIRIGGTSDANGINPAPHSGQE